MTKYSVNDCVKYDYSDIGEYVDENHTDKPLRNDEVCDLLNRQEEQLNAFKNLAKDYNLTIDILYEVCREYLDDETVIE